MSLDYDKSGQVSSDEFLRIPEIAANPLRHRIISVFDENKDDEVDFSEFISALSIFRKEYDEEKKLRLAFSVYDVSGDGFITNGELFTVLKMMVGSNLSDIQLQQVVDKTILEADKDKDGKISFEEFKCALKVKDVDSKMTISLF
jgi:serine/threonine-protein phosphatase 2B regulatory subunit